MQAIDVAVLNTGKVVQLLMDKQYPQFDTKRQWSLVGTPIGARPRKQDIYWVRTTNIAKRYSVSLVKWK